jgi:AbrB family looped-hinge helix DNA binding protein
MAAIMKISSQGQIRLPKKIMQTLKIDSGDYVELEIEDGNIVLKPRKLIDPSQGWFWTKEWQKKESETDKQIQNNNIVLKPRKLIDPSQGWFWTKEWQKKESETDKQIQNNELSPLLQTAEEGIGWLKK